MQDDMQNNGEENRQKEGRYAEKWKREHAERKTICRLQSNGEENMQKGRRYAEQWIGKQAERKTICRTMEKRTGGKEDDMQNNRQVIRQKEDYIQNNEEANKQKGRYSEQWENSIQIGAERTGSTRMTCR
jgi:hypothetical protein